MDSKNGSQGGQETPPQQKSGSYSELAAFKKAYGLNSKFESAPSSRSNSFRNKPRPKGVQNVLCDIPRRNSMPDSHHENFLKVKSEPLRRVRSFKTTSKGIVNRGDTFRQSTGSIASSGSGNFNEKTKFGKTDEVSADTVVSRGFEPASDIPNVYRVALCGSVGVGKTALVNQFKTSEYMGGFEISIGDVEDEMTVSILLDGEESTLEFHDVTDNQENLQKLKVDAYVVVFSVNNTETWDIAKDTLHKLRNEMKTDRTIILVANKIDLVRKRLISATDARKLADQYECKFIETSVALNHQVDELLVGILRQIRLKMDETKSKKTVSKPRVKKTGPLAFLDRLFSRKKKEETSSCDNLNEL